MALRTFGTTAQNSLSAVQFGPNGLMTDSDLAAFNALIQPNYGGMNPNDGRLGTYVSREGQLWVPNKGWIRAGSGDWLVVDPTTGFPFLISKNSVAFGAFVHT
jgi:hypothetical protein